MQNKARTSPPLEIRATDYSALGISLNKGQISNQIWILAEDVKKLLPGGAFSNYVPKDEVSGKTYPSASGIMFVSLTQLSKEETVAGELALFLLGKTSNVKSEEVKRISDTLIKSCEEFCNDKGVKKSMSVREKWMSEARIEGLEEGMQQGLQQGMQQGTRRTIAMLTELVNSGLSIEDAIAELNSRLTQQ